MADKMFSNVTGIGSTFHPPVHQNSTIPNYTLDGGTVPSNILSLSLPIVNSRFPDSDSTTIDDENDDIGNGEIDSRMYRQGSLYHTPIMNPYQNFDPFMGYGQQDPILLTRMNQNNHYPTYGIIPNNGFSLKYGADGDNGQYGNTGYGQTTGYGSNGGGGGNSYNPHPQYGPAPNQYQPQQHHQYQHYQPQQQHYQPRQHKSKHTRTAMSALTLLAFLFFLHILQNCLKEHMEAMNPTVMVMTAGAGRLGRTLDTVKINDPRNDNQKYNNGTTDVVGADYEIINKERDWNNSDEKFENNGDDDGIVEIDSDYESP